VLGGQIVEVRRDEVFAVLERHRGFIPEYREIEAKARDPRCELTRSNRSLGWQHFFGIYRVRRKLEGDSPNPRSGVLDEFDAFLERLAETRSEVIAWVVHIPGTYRRTIWETADGQFLSVFRYDQRTDQSTDTC
jgi:hypothetical protein